jgi:hypothetical protein
LQRSRNISRHARNTGKEEKREGTNPGISIKGNWVGYWKLRFRGSVLVLFGIHVWQQTGGLVASSFEGFCCCYCRFLFQIPVL